MFWIDKKSYKRTLSVLRKEEALLPMFVELKQFIESEFDLTIYDITIKKYSIFNNPKKYSLAYGKKYALICQVATIAERESMQNKIPVQINGGHQAFKMEFDKQKQQRILSKFFELSKKYNFSINAKANEIWLDYYWWFPVDYMSSIVDKTEKPISKAILQEYKLDANIWQIVTNGYSVIVFYKTEAQKETNAQNGISESIKSRYFLAFKAVDEFGFYKDEYIFFDSKENLDKNYGGSLYTYMR